jgi:hypothetical protein
MMMETENIWQVETQEFGDMMRNPRGAEETFRGATVPVSHREDILVTE